MPWYNGILSSLKVGGIGIPEFLWEGKLPTQQGPSHLLCVQNVHLHCVKPPTLSVIPNQWFPKCDLGPTASTSSHVNLEPILIGLNHKLGGYLSSNQPSE